VVCVCAVQPVNLGSSKAKSLNNQRKKPALLMWTSAWRRLNKKANTEGAIKKKARKVVKIQRAIVGASLEDVSVNEMLFAVIMSKLMIRVQRYTVAEEANCPQGHQRRH
jgi:hypothetical protein